MMQRFLIMLVMALAATPLLAQDVAVRSGAHDGFSRIVIDLPQRRKWQLQKVGDAHIVSFEEGALRFDTSAVYQRITTQRLMAIAPDPARNGLRLTLGCDCSVDAFWAGNSMLVVDIRDSGVPTKNPEVAAAPEPPSDGTNGASTLITGTESLNPEKVIPDLETGQSQASLLTAEGLAPELARSDELNDPLLTDRLVAARQRLAEQIGRAASQGLLTARDPAEGSAPPLDSGAAATPRTMVQDPGHIVKTTHPNVMLHAETSIDHEINARAGQTAQTADGTACLPEAAFDVMSWGDDQAFSLQIGPLRAALTQERDKIQPATALDLARAYLFFGFGAEAAQVLTIANLTGQEARIATALAAILELGHAPEGNAFVGQLDCDSPVAMWAVLAHEALPDGALVDDDAVLRALSALPVHLRRYLGPILARRFLAAGRNPMAERILRILDRGPEAPAPAHDLAEAEAEIAGGDMDTADRGLGTVVQSNSDRSAEALLRRIETRLATGRGIPQDMAELAGAYAVEQSETALGISLTRAYIEAMAASGAFDAAIAELARLAPDLPDKPYARAVSTVLSLLTDADDVTFLRHALAMQDKAAPLIEPQIGNRVAERSLALGFSDAARGYLAQAATGADLRDRRLLRARMDLLDGKPRQALVDLLGVEGKDANLLRAKAQSAIGAHQAAGLLYQSGGDAESANREVLMGEDWDRLITFESEDTARLADLASSSLPQPSDGSGPLARNRALLDSSEEMRATVISVLETRAVPDLGGE